MLDLDFQPELVGRDSELNALLAHMESAKEGKGCGLFVSGEAGIGKTRLLLELKRIAKSRGFRVLSGNCTFESLTPYMPFMEALKSGGLESMFAEQSPKVEGVYLVSGGGLLIAESLRAATQLDPDLFASMLASVSNFVKDTLSMMSGEEKEGSLNVLGYEKYRIVIEAGENANIVVVLTGEENEFLLNEMRAILAKVEAGYGSVLKGWDGDRDALKGVEEILRQLISSGKYDGIYYGKENPETRRYLLFENVSLGLRRQAQAKPVLLCIEDMQWVDPSTLALLHYVLRNTRRSCVLVVCTYRPEDVAARSEVAPHPLVDAMQLMNREGLLETVSLTRLSSESADRLLSSVFRKAEFSEEFRDRLNRETEGNPLFIIELAKLLVAEEAVRFQGGRWTLVKGLDDVSIPSKVYDVIRRRLNRLREDEREVIEYAAVIGVEFTSSVLARVTGMERIKLLRQLRSLEQTHRLIRSFESRYKFDHTKIKEVLYGEMPAELRRECHSIVARAIEELNKDNLDAVIGDLAFHYYMCRDPEKAVPALLRAAEIAKKGFANTEAVRFYTEALQLIRSEGGRPQDRLTALQALNEVYQLTGQYEKAMRLLEEIRGATDDKTVIARTHRSAGALFEKQGQYDRALEELSTSASILEGGETAELGRVIAFTATVYMRKGEYDTALRRCEMALRIYRAHQGEDRDIAQVHNIMGILHYYKGEHAEALKNYEQALTMREEIGDTQGIASCLSNIGIVRHAMGDIAAAIEYSMRGLAIAEKIGDRRGIMASLINVGSYCQRGGDYARALEYLERALAIAETIGDRKGVAACLNNIGSSHSNKGEYESALEDFRRGLAITEEIGDQVGVIDNLNNIGFAYKEMGEDGKALEYFRRGLALSEKIGNKSGMANCYCGIAEVSLRKGDIPEATEFCTKACDLAGEAGLREYVADSKRIFGMICREQGRWDESARRFEESVRLLREMGLGKELGDAFYEFGMMWKEKGDPGKAVEMLREAEGIFEKLKLEKRAGKARGVLRDLSQTRGTP